MSRAAIVCTPALHCCRSIPRRPITWGSGCSASRGRATGAPRGPGAPSIAADPDALDRAGESQARRSQPAGFRGVAGLYDPDGPRWSELGGKVAEALVKVNPTFLGHWLYALPPCGAGSPGRSRRSSSGAAPRPSTSWPPTSSPISRPTTRTVSPAC